jgi:hypothetical protein
MPCKLTSKKPPADVLTPIPAELFDQIGRTRR